MTIPKLIHQTFEHKNFSSDLQEIVDEWSIENPLFSHKVYDNEECNKFIKDNFSSRIYQAYIRIKPEAFKADLWRYCILYKFGGFYVDIDTLCIGSLEEFIKDSIDFVSPIDLIDFNHGSYIVFNGFIGCTPNHPIMMNCIERILKWIKLETIPNSNYDFSGPGCLGKSVNHHLGRKEDESLIGCEGIYQKTMLIYFEVKNEYVRDLNNKKILQNKHRNPYLKKAYNEECNKNPNRIDWGKCNKFEDVIDTRYPPLYPSFRS
tara:strand:+ start:172 stop:957 length:786 start_codon:yes stop_codon:yes gene_type:complete